MKEILLPFRYNMILPSGETDLTAIMEEMKQIRSRGSKIIGASLAIEELMIDIIKATMFSEMKTELEFVTGVILKSDWCSYSAKKKLLLSCLEKYSLCEPKKRGEIDSYLAKVMRYRNAFAHGEIIFHEHNYVIKYFEGQSKEAVLNDEYWLKLENEFKVPFDSLNEIMGNLTKK